MYEQGKVSQAMTSGQIKLLSEFFSQFTFQHFMSDSNSENNNSQGFKNSRMVVRGCV